MMTMSSSLSSSELYPVSSALKITGTSHSRASQGDSEFSSRSVPGFVKDRIYDNTKGKMLHYMVRVARDTASF